MPLWALLTFQASSIRNSSRTHTLKILRASVKAIRVFDLYMYITVPASISRLLSRGHLHVVLVAMVSLLLSHDCRSAA